MPEPGLTWDDVFREDEPEAYTKMIEMSRNERLKNEGCVVRALSSVIQVPLSREQEDLRLNQKDKYESNFVYAMMDKKSRGEVVGDLEIELERMIKEEQMRVIEYITAIQKQTDTSAGRELRKYRFGYKSLTVEEITKEYKKGNQVIWAELFHAAHIVPVDSNNFISLSDGNIPFPLSRVARHDVIVFEKRDINSL
jgi:hypothetical protein